MVIDRMDDNGRGITYVDGKITFVPNALPNEDVEIKITNSKKNYNEAEVIKWNTQSKDRVQPICPYFEECGGCDLMHLSYEKELEFKKEKVENILKKFGGIDFKIEKIISPTTLNYRNKATFHVDKKIGYYKKKTNEIIEIDKCALVDNKINDILNKIKDFDLTNIYQIIIKASKNTDESMIIIKCSGKITEEFKKLDVTSIIKYDEYYEVIKGNDSIIEKIDDFSYLISPESFFQVNTLGATALYEKVKEYISLNGNENVLDLYCGTGTIGIFVSKEANEVTGVEINKMATLDAVKNKKLNHIDNIDFVCDDVANIFIKDIDAAIIDPPRSGLDDKTINYLNNLNLKKLIYVSCDPVTLARDLKKLKYKIIDITLVNMFPRTSHCESVCVLERR